MSNTSNVKNKQNVFVEIAMTNNCNGNCAYCFESKHSGFLRDLAVEKREIELLVDACNTFDANKYNYLTVSFWGGEPFLNTPFMFQVFENTYRYKFVKYHCYSNGLLLNEYAKLVSKPWFNEIKNRLHIQLSYDGEPHHILKRGNNGQQVLETANFLRNLGVSIAFKATLSYDLLDKLPEIWDSYYALAEKFNHTISYYPTLDTSSQPPDDETYDKWQKAVIEVAKKEYNYIKQHNRSLWQWFTNGRKMNCGLQNSIYMHTDGNIYICHGCPYLQNSNRFFVKNINEISSLYELIPNKFNVQLNETCQKCEATHCSACHVTQLRDTDDIYKNWSDARTYNKEKCKYYKWFGYIAKLLNYEIIKSNKSNNKV